MVQKRSDDGAIDEHSEQESKSDTVVVLDGLEMPAAVYRRIVAQAGHDDVNDWITEAIERRFDAEEGEGESPQYGEGEYGSGGYGIGEQGE